MVPINIPTRGIIAVLVVIFVAGCKMISKSVILRLISLPQTSINSNLVFATIQRSKLKNKSHPHLFGDNRHLHEETCCQDATRHSTIKCTVIKVTCSSKIIETCTWKLKEIRLFRLHLHVHVRLSLYKWTTITLRFAPAAASSKKRKVPWGAQSGRTSAV